MSVLLLPLAVGVAGGLASVVRYLLDAAWPLQRGFAPTAGQPWGLWAANMIGTFIIGLSVHLASQDVRTVVAAGLAGGLTTWSTWIISAQARWSAAAALPLEGRRRERAGVVVQIAGQAAAGGFAAWLGLALGELLF
jgi:CrcB protein